ncbi:DUF4232 domain-containing protein [Streptomyces sp. NPDC057428]|uniref:DUF4232 domain-containing protein n=1 Tax=Streptomyces sp. NPDC057428 TaxID=3346129 RepID=UPI003685C16E
MPATRDDSARWGGSGGLRRVVSAAVLAACAVGLTACGAGGGEGDSASGTSTGTPSVAAPAPTASSATADPGSASAPPSGSSAGQAGQSDSPRPAPAGSGSGGRCEAGDLSLAFVPNGQEMNSEYFDLRLRNTGSAPCTLLGYPGVSLADAQGRRVGEPASRSSDGGTAGHTVTLRPGHSAHAVVKTGGEGVSGGDCWPSPASMTVYPPGSKESVTTQNLDGLRVCGDVFSVGPVTEAAPLSGG